MHVAQDLIDAVHELGTGAREPARFGREATRVRVGADTRGLEASPARDDDAPRQHLVALLLGDRVGLARQHRLVDLEAVDGAQDPVGRDLISGNEVAEIAEDDVGHRQFPNLAVAHGARSGRIQNREAVERPLRSILLDDADEHVEQEHDAEERVLAVAEHEDERERGAEDRVEPGENVRPQDLRERAARALVGDIDLPGACALCDLFRSQPVGSRGGSGTRDSGVAHRTNATDPALSRLACARAHTMNRIP